MTENLYIIYINGVANYVYATSYIEACKKLRDELNEEN